MKGAREVQGTLSWWTPVAVAQALLWFFGLPLLIRPEAWESFWSTYSPMVAEVILNCTGMILFFFYALTSVPIYYLQLPFLEQYKISDKPWPWARGQPEATRRAFWALAQRSVMLYLFNNIFLVPLATIGKFYAVELAGLRQLDFSAATWPS